MFHPLSLFVGLRYVRARSHKFFVSFITWVSLLGVCVGVAALIVILSVMNGFEGELRERLLALSSHARIVPAAAVGEAVAPATDAQWADALARARALPQVLAAAPYVEIQALAVHSPDMLPVQLRGIDPALEPGVTSAATSVIEGRLADLKPGANGVIVGSVIAQQLALVLGDRLNLLLQRSEKKGLKAADVRVRVRLQNGDHLRHNLTRLNDAEDLHGLFARGVLLCRAKRIH